MPQDKRLIISKAVLYKLQRVCQEAHADPGEEGIYLSFLLPSVVLSQVPELLHPTDPFLFNVPHNVYKNATTSSNNNNNSESTLTGRTTCLIVPKQIAFDCTKINKRHQLFDAVVTAEAICKRGDEECLRRAMKVASTFTHFMVDSRILSKLPMCLVDAVKQSQQPDHQKKKATQRKKFIIPLSGLDERENLTFRLSQGVNNVILFMDKQTGQLHARVGHGNMTAGDICSNGKSIIVLLKKNFPNAMKYINEFKLTSEKTDSIRFMEVQIQK
ncbi:hypothetical protein AGDE_00172 [Angomonas deanei]|nr:hypothetical protein AGDE_10585 [Angomonas deanei]EPY43749.1 hypothetical protein AGDE_00172 [Angomonas deanei]|eukprot:EPY28031.1 hypothetical protein AGDE_10585 [Angomonas deanei]